ncbi:hypothetical protein [Compostimonas suwonensis]|uniref:Alpha/beta hydrolase family protein n=1 Tax=Compostimonas suwonensis TaxID=1048394 RepID=A0A2M9BZB2_9MICO|nr:hypothetical protein [Compostimonas suwonensis]PJJ63414.1 hypothetical protein CLV54_1079 [Compostimonas suwonensis]
MALKLLYLHGTGPQSESSDRARIEAHLELVGGLAPADVHLVDWVDSTAHLAYLDVTPALPAERYPLPSPARRGLVPAGTASLAHAAALEEAAESAQRPLDAEQVAGGLAAAVAETARGEQREEGGILTASPFAELGLQVLTNHLVDHRPEYTNAATVFLGAVARYLEDGPAFRASIREAIAEHTNRGDTLLVVGHSLGGVAALDVLTGVPDEPEVDAAAVELLVTAGCQAPWLYLMHALASLSTEVTQTEPFSPWLNVYDERDLLAFCVERVFADRPGRRVDVEVSSHLPFLTAHGHYLDDPAFYRAIGAARRTFAASRTS